MVACQVTTPHPVAGLLLHDLASTAGMPTFAFSPWFSPAKQFQMMLWLLLFLLLLLLLLLLLMLLLLLPLRC